MNNAASMALGKSEIRLDIRPIFSDFNYSTPSAPLHECVIRGVFLCPDFGPSKQMEVGWSI